MGTQVSASTLLDEDIADLVAADLHRLHPLVAHLESIPTKPTLDQVITAVQAETGLDRELVSQAIGWMGRVVSRARMLRNREYFPTKPELEHPRYQVIKTIFPHGTAPVPGTAADLVQELLIDPSRGETGLMHDRRETGDQLYCTMSIVIGFVE